MTSKSSNNAMSAHPQQAAKRPREQFLTVDDACDNVYLLQSAREEINAELQGGNVKE